MPAASVKATFTTALPGWVIVGEASPVAPESSVMDASGAFAVPVKVKPLALILVTPEKS